MTKKLDEAKRQHEKYLRKMGAHPDQIRSRKKQASKNKKSYTSGLSIEQKQFMHPIDTYSDTGLARGIYANIHNEPEHVVNGIKKLAKRVMPLYNKGGYQLASEHEDMTQVGQRSRR